MGMREVYLMDKAEFNQNYLPYAQKISDKLGLGKVDTVYYSYHSAVVGHDCNGLHIYVRREQTLEEFTSGKSDDEL